MPASSCAQHGRDHMPWLKRLHRRRHAYGPTFPPHCPLLFVFSSLVLTATLTPLSMVTLMLPVLLLAVGVLFADRTVQAQNSSAGLNFGPVSFEGYENYVYRDNITSVQLVVSGGSSNTAPSRFITAFPRGNTGTVVYFVPLAGNGTNSSAPLGTTLNLTSVQSYQSSFNQTGVQGSLSVSADLQFGVTLIGGVRTVRDYTESGGTVFNSLFNYTLGPSNSSSVTLIRRWINGTTVQYLSFDVLSNGNITVIPNFNATIPPNITLTRPNSSQNATLRFTSSFNFTSTTPSTPFVPLQGLGREQLFLTSSPANSSANLPSVLTSIQNNSAIANQLAFLSYQSEFLAGGWRFLTYFGRDTLLALRLLLPVISPTSAEAILGAVISRINETGTICHEETVGDYASFVNIQQNRSEAGNTPSYNYVMVDTDFLLLPVLAEYFLSTPQGQGRAPAFLNQTSTLKNGTFSALLQENIVHVLNLSRPFAEAPQTANLVQIRDPVVGNWRDSAAGLGYGKFPFDVNCALVPAALRGIARLAGAGIISANYSNVSTTYAGVWEREASQYFRVPITPSTAQARLDDYVTRANLSSALLAGAGALNGTNNTATGNTTARGWSAANQTIGVGQNSTFYGVSLSANGSAVEILNSDLGFVLLYANNVSQSIMQATVEALQPYPRGLLTNVGLVVANAAYDSNRTNIQVFSNLAYHGAVSWSWQQGLMASGLSRQLRLCGLSNSTQLSSSPSNSNTNTTAIDTIPAWCANTTFTATVLAAQARLWDSISGAASALYTEVLSPVFNTGTGRFTIGNLGELSPEGTEGDAIQLWSYGFLAQVDPRTGRAVAGGF